MERKNTGWKVLVCFLLIVILAMGGFILYDKVLKDKYFSKDKTKETDKKEKCNQTADERYKEYLKILQKSLETNFKDKSEYMDEDDLESYNVNNFFTKEEVVPVVYNGNQSYISTMIDTTGLTVEIDEEVVKKIEDVVYSRIISSVTSPEKDIYYITSDGEVYDIELFINDEGKYEIEKTDGVEHISNLNLKNIVSIEPAFSGLRSGDITAIFTDIDGKVSWSYKN